MSFVDACNTDLICVYMVQWFERARRLWVKVGSSRNETLIKLAEDFFDALMVSN